MSKQRTPEWYAERAGKFTASQFHRLMKSGRRKDEIFGDAAMTYIMETIAEIMTGGQSIEFKQFDSRATDWGNEREPEAAKVYAELTGLKVEECSFFPISDFAGASPDRLVDDDGLMEIKCPYDATNHIRYMRIRTPEQLLETKPEYYWQIQGQLLATGRQWCDFVSYDPRVLNDRYCIHKMRIVRDEDIMETLRLRLFAARDLMREIITDITKTDHVL